MNRQAGFGLSLLLMGAGIGSFAVTASGLASILLVVPAGVVTSLGVGVLTGQIDTPVPNKEMDDFASQTYFVLLIIGTFALIGFICLIVI